MIRLKKEREMKAAFAGKRSSEISWRKYLKVRDYNKDINKMCEDCISNQMERHGEIVISCKGLAGSTQILSDEMAHTLSGKELLLAETMTNPYAWANAYISPKKFKERWYQEQLSRCTAKRLTIRCGRRSGKSFSLSLKMVHKAALSEKKILIVTPYEVQAAELMNTMIELLYALDPEYDTYAGVVKRFVKSPTYLLEFRNGSKIKAFTTGSSGSGSVRGQCLPGDTGVYLSTGKKKLIKDIRSGDTVQSMSSNRVTMAEVTKIFDTNTKTRVKVVLQSGRRVYGSLDHRFNGSSLSFCDRISKMDDETFETEWKTLEDWKVGEYISVATQLIYSDTDKFDHVDLQLIGWNVGANERNSTATCLEEDITCLPPEKQMVVVESMISASGYLLPDASEIGFRTISKTLAKQYRGLLMAQGVAVSIEEQESLSRHPLYVLRVVDAGDILKLLQRMCIADPKPILASLLEEAERVPLRTDYRYIEDIYLDRIVSFELEDQEVMYDIEVAGTHNFIIDDGIVTHNSADIIVLDEVDYMSEADFAAILAILADNPDVELWVASTPNGKTQLHKLEGLPSYRSYHFPSYVIPHYSDELDEEFRRQFSDIPYVQEVMAEFGEADMSVFQDVFIESAIDEEVDRDRVLKYRSGYIVVMGVDWNHDKNGTRIILAAFDRQKKHFIIAHRSRVSREGWTQVDAVNEIIAVNREYKCDHIYLDEGFGQAQIEFIKQYGLDQRGKVPVGHPDINLSEVVGINFASKIEVIPVNGGDIIKKDVKPYMVDNATRILERGALRLTLPEDDSLIRELSNYCVKSRSPTGRPIYGVIDSKIGDHDLDALMISLLGFSMEYSELINGNQTSSPVIMVSRDVMEGKNTEENVQNIRDVSMDGSLYSTLKSGGHKNAVHSTGSVRYNRSSFGADQSKGMNLFDKAKRKAQRNSQSSGRSSW